MIPRRIKFAVPAGPDELGVMIRQGAARRQLNTRRSSRTVTANNPDRRRPGFIDRRGGPSVNETHIGERDRRRRVCEPLDHSARAARGTLQRT